jgi:hypothetical protein
MDNDPMPKSSLRPDLEMLRVAGPYAVESSLKHSDGSDLDFLARPTQGPVIDPKAVVENAGNDQLTPWRCYG